MKEHKLQPHQKELVEKVYKLNLNNLFYLVSQPNEKYNNHTVNELKKHIKSGIKKYTRDHLLHKYFNGAENKLFQYVLFIEYPKDFYQALSITDIDLFSLYNAPHFHLFISSRNTFVSMPQLFFYIFKELSSQKIKELSVKKYDYLKLENISRRFIEYHTKQHYHYIDNNRVMINQ